MNRKVTITRLILIVLLVVIVLFTILNYILTQSNGTDSARKNAAGGYHLQIVTEKDRDYFWNDFKEGAQQAAEEAGVYVEFVESDTRTTEDVVSLVKRGVYTDVDGIAFRPTDITECAKVVNLAKENGVSIINFESEENILPLTGSINSDYFQIGEEQGKLLMEASGRKGGVAVIVNEKDMQDGESLCNAEKMRGIMENFTEGQDMEILDYYKVNPEMFRTEQTVMQVFEEHPDVENIICTDASITRGVAAYIEREKLAGQVHLIGYGNMQETLEDIKSGLIYGTVYADARSIGMSVVQKLCSILEGTGKEDIESVKAKVIKGE